MFQADPEAAAELLFELELDGDAGGGAGGGGIPSSEAAEEEDGRAEGRVEDEGALLWRELVTSLGEDAGDRDGDESDED